MHPGPGDPVGPYPAPSRSPFWQNVEDEDPNSEQESQRWEGGSSSISVSSALKW